MNFPDCLTLHAPLVTKLPFIHSCEYLQIIRHIIKNSQVYSTDRRDYSHLIMKQKLREKESQNYKPTKKLSKNLLE